MLRRTVPAIVALAVIAGLSAPATASSIPVTTAACPSDIDGNDAVDFADLLAVLSAWGPCGGCPEDIDASGVVDFGDLLLVLSGWGPCPADQSIELAGRALSSFPYFEFVRTFNEGSPVAVAIDPAQVPGDGSCDLYVVASRTEDEWAGNPALVDVRPGGAQAVAFNGGTIQANTVTVAESTSLEGDAVVGFGVDYDVVCDFNQNGTYDAGDRIDGLDTGGFTVIGDMTALGPHATASVNYSGGTWLGQRTWYPTDLDAMAPRPLVVISHGNGHSYTWYDYLQRHLASYGYIVMSHQNNTMPGIETASTTTLENTDYFLGNLTTIAGGIFDGHIDSSRITWIGHSRGGEGVSRAYDRLFDGVFVPDDYTIDDIVLVSSIAPNDYLGRERSNPHGVPYHLLIGAADGDNGGWPDRESDAPYHVFERAEGYRHVTNVHGADHNDFNCCGGNDFSGPPGTAIGRAEAQRVAKAIYLPLIEHYVAGNRAARDFLWRQYEVFRPLGVDPDTVVNHEFVEGPHAGWSVLDDFQSAASLALSSSGGAVSGDVLARVELIHDDTDGTFTWSTGDPMNGMSRGRPDDISAGTAFGWNMGGDRFLEFAVPPAMQDLSEFVYLSFRAGQGTRHPDTVAELADLSFTITLRDASGTSSAVNFDAYGAGIQEPYQRTGSGSGAGWQTEYETLRLRLTDFLHNRPLKGAAIDLASVAAVRFDFGGTHGSSRGRIALDDLGFSRDEMPGPPIIARGARRPAPLPTPALVWPGPLDEADIPAPTGIRRLVSHERFVLAEAFVHAWRLEQPLVRSGHVLVLEVDPAMLRPRQSREPVLYVGRQTAERVNLGAETGMLVVIVPDPISADRPSRFDAANTPIWFGAPALPEQVDQAWIEREFNRARAAQVGGPERALAGPIQTRTWASKRELLRAVADDIERFAPDETTLIDTLRMP